MITFLVSLVALVLGYLLYGRFVERVFAPDDRVTPAVAKADGLDYIVLPNWKIFMIQFLKWLICGLCSAVFLLVPYTITCRVCFLCVMEVLDCQSLLVTIWVRPRRA